jgi:rod shape-determining protein MreB and related proteins
VLFSRQIGIDLGTANVLVFVRGQGIVINEPSVVAISTTDNRIQAVGDQASQMLGRTPGSIHVIRPMRSGVIADYVVTEAMLRYFIAKVCGRFRMWKPEVMVSVPCGVTSVERRAVTDAALQAGAREVYLIQEPLAAAIGANVPISYPSGNMIVNIGGGTTEVAVISLNGIVVSQSERVGGNRIDDAIAAYIKRKYNLIIGDHMAEEIKIEVGSALPLEQPLTVDVRGRDQVAGLPKTVRVTSTEITEAIAEPVEQIVLAVKHVLERTPPELSSDIIDKGMVMTGGTSLLRNLDRLLTNVTGIPCHVAERPLDCVALGTGLALENLDVLKKSLARPY